MRSRQFVADEKQTDRPYYAFFCLSFFLCAWRACKERSLSRWLALLSVCLSVCPLVVFVVVVRCY